MISTDDFDTSLHIFSFLYFLFFSYCLVLLLMLGGLVSPIRISGKLLHHLNVHILKYVTQVENVSH